MSPELSANAGDLRRLCLPHDTHTTTSALSIGAPVPSRGRQCPLNSPQMTTSAVNSMEERAAMPSLTDRPTTMYAASALPPGAPCVQQAPSSRMRDNPRKRSTYADNSKTIIKAIGKEVEL